jgi:DNA gyrase inhibitor GyrI
MNTPEIRILQLRPLHVASLVGTGTTPELDGWGRLLAWAQAGNHLSVTPPPRFFGFDVFRKGHDLYEYEVMMTVGQGIKSDHFVTIKDLSGGLYAAAHVKDVKNVPDGWIALEEWLKKSTSFKIGDHQCLEEHLRFIGLPKSDYELELLLPIEPVIEAVNM